MISDLLSSRCLPDFLSGVSSLSDWGKKRSEIIDVLCREEYGFLPEPPSKVSAELIMHDNYFGGKADYEELSLSFEINEKAVSFTIRSCFPSGEGKYPVFVMPNFRPFMPDKYIPLEEICDNGFALISFDYNDAALDSEALFNDSIAAAAFGGERSNTDCGKIGLWAYAASRVADYALTLPKTDEKNLAVIGHSRLGKTALLAGALDERFAFIMANDSGCAGDAVFRGKGGETAAKIYNRFPFWFCENFAKYADNEQAMPFDNHWLLALIAPRKLCIGSAMLDLWADPVSQYLSCCEASKAYELYGIPGFIHPDYVPEEPCDFCSGNIAFHLRNGTHSFNRDDWHCYMSYMAKHKND